MVKTRCWTERHGFVEHRPVIEAEYHAALDRSFAADALEQIARRNERPVDVAKQQESVRDALDEADRDGSRHDRARRRQRHQESQQAERHSRAHLFHLPTFAWCESDSRRARMYVCAISH